MDIYSGILAIKKNEIIFFATTCIDLEFIIHRPRDYHTEWSKSENNKNHMILLKCGTYFFKWCKCTYLQNRNRLTGTKTTYGYQRGNMVGRDKSRV